MRRRGSQAATARASARLRAGIFCLCLGSIGVYFLVNRWTTRMDAASLSTAVDRSIPFCPAWEHVYVSFYLFLVLPVASIADSGYLRRYALAFIVTQVLAWIGFVLYPVRMVRPEDIAVVSFAAWILKLNHALDAPTNCFPSLHVANALFAGLVVLRVDRLVGGIATALALAIALSTLLAKHHYLLDVIVGILLAGAAYGLLMHGYPFPGDKPEDRRLPRGWPALLVVIHTAAVIICYVLYRRGVPPG